MAQHKAAEGYRVIVCATADQDAEQIIEILDQDGQITSRVRDIVDLAALIGDDIGVVVITDGALERADGALQNRMAAQPAWSDIPFVVLARQGAPLERRRTSSSDVDFAANAFVLERPLSAASLLSATRASLRARQKQFAMRDRLAELGAIRSDLQQREAQLRLATEAAEIGLWDVDPINDTLFWPPRVKTMFGISADVPVTLDDFYRGLHPEDAPHTAAAFASAIDPQTRTVYDVEYRTVGKEDGVIRWLAAKGRGIFDDVGRCVRVIGTAIDITDRKAAELALRDSEERLRLAMDAGGQGSWRLDLQTSTLEASPHCRGNFGFGPDQKFDYADLNGSVHPEDRDRMQGAVASAIADRAVYDIEYRIVRPDKSEGWVHVRGKPQYAADGSPQQMLGVSSDITVRKRNELDLVALATTLEQRVADRTADLMQAEEALRQSQKMEAVGQLTGGLAHDFNNLLAGISGSLELMGTRLSQGRLTEIDKYIVAAQGAAKRAAALTHRLLAFSRRQTLTPRAVNINALVTGMLDLIQRTVGPGIEVQHVGASGLWSALVDASQLENALLNLCINARDAMPDGGRITIETGNRWIDRQGAKQHHMPEGQYLSLCVTDTGVGMTADVVAKAFDPFFTTKPLGQGTGLGLSMIYGFAHQSGGQVRIYSEPGEGTMVCIYLPRHWGDAEREPASPEMPVLALAEAGETILVVDDEPTVRLLVTDVLEELGYTSIEAADSASGLRVLQSDARIDLLITDVSLPGGMNGRQMADAARAHRAKLKVLFITGFAENALLNNGQLEPGMSVLTKPFAVDTLSARIVELINS